MQILSYRIQSTLAWADPQPTRPPLEENCKAGGAALPYYHDDCNHEYPKGMNRAWFAFHGMLLGMWHRVFDGPRQVV